MHRAKQIFNPAWYFFFLMVALDIFVLSDGEWHLRPSLFMPLVNGSLFSFLFRFLIFSPQTYNHLFVPPGRLGSGICCSYTIAHNSKIHWVCMQPRPRSANATQKQQADTKGRLGNILGRSGQFPVVWVQFQLCSSIGSFLWVFRGGRKPPLSCPGWWAVFLLLGHLPLIIKRV